jgi:hypothetical protein
LARNSQDAEKSSEVKHLVEVRYGGKTFAVENFAPIDASARPVAMLGDAERV